ncbi:MAG: hypothetical protein KKF30_15930 [Proteobacteria bacterium]|nr:hypothetical protein [Pseudomonadota bacterium]MBU4472087.1 hypothetical protein [Pseudomonadota bacterium]MCG2752914.1 hypothetical protein [Desulfobacteraceae bacterium]
MATSIDKNSDKESIIQAFHQNWNLHPFPVLLLQADRTILAVNEPGRKLGVPVGKKCFQLTGKDKVCPYCQANTAMKEKRGIQVGSYQEARKQFVETFWVPLEGEEKIFLHYGNDITQWVKEELLVSPLPEQLS